MENTSRLMRVFLLLRIKQEPRCITIDNYKGCSKLPSVVGPEVVGGSVEGPDLLKIRMNVFQLGAYIRQSKALGYINSTHKLIHFTKEYLDSTCEVF